MQEEPNAEESAEAAGELGSERPTYAHCFDFAIGGRHHREVDREFFAEVRTLFPGIEEALLNSRRFTWAAQEHLAASGIDQYLDLGAGLPTVDPVHEIAARHLPPGRAPTAVYVDIDATAVAHAREIVAPHPRVTAVQGDAADVEGVLADPEVAALLDLDRPLGVIATGVLHYLTDDDAAALVATLSRVTAPGSALAVATITGEGREEITRWAAYHHTGLSYAPRLRTPAVMSPWLAGWHVPDPGWCSAPHWRAGASGLPGADTAGTGYWGVVAYR